MDRFLARVGQRAVIGTTMSSMRKKRASVVERHYEPQESVCERAVKELVQKAAVGVRGGEKREKGDHDDSRAKEIILRRA